MNIALDTQAVSGHDSGVIRASFVDRMGNHMEAEGLPRIAGRLFGLLILTPEPVSFGALAETLQVSRGSISTNARLLEGKGLIERVAMPGDRQDFFRLAERPYANMMFGIIARMRETLTTIAQTADALPDGNDVARARLDEARLFFETAVAGFAEIAARLAGSAARAQTPDGQ
ncbi:MarR family transcriptional regulator [Aurantimonas sp. A2-1-M11]|uniref:GbsR/MarR family transcriptional regulator n=1 Tax=Aurantimonas sp. A2-1-M11 TaxID=3113712 RepID=UPI002F93894C